MAPPRKLPLYVFLLVAAAGFLCTAIRPAAAQGQGYCRDSLAGLSECESFMYGGAAAPTRACCAAYEAAFDADPFCLCYVADGTYGRATGRDVDVDRALRIPAACGLGQPPVELCNMEGLVLPPYAPQGGAPAQPPAAAGAGAPDAQPPSGSGSSSPPVAPPTFSAPPPPTSEATRDPLPELLLMLVAAVILLNI